MDFVEKEIFKMMVEVLSLPPRTPQIDSSAILLLPGKHQDYRVHEAVKLWPVRGKYFWVAGTRGDPTYSRADIIKIIGRDSNDITVAGFAEHTKGQMEWVCEMVSKNPQVADIVVTTAAYHVPRCVLTLLKSLQNISRPVGLSVAPLLNTNGSSFTEDDLAGEMTRIKEYQGIDHVASLEEWKEYLAWHLETREH